MPKFIKSIRIEWGEAGMKKKFKTVFYTVIILILVSVLCSKYSTYAYIYRSPETNANVFKYIAKNTKELNKILYAASDMTNQNLFNTKILYTDGYGSVFLKKNITAGDLDYSIGLYLGEFNYDGTNSEKIAQDITKIVQLYKTNIANYIKHNNLDYIPADGEGIYSEQTNITNKIIAQSIERAITGKGYKIKINGTVFEMEPYTVLFPNYEQLKLYSNNIAQLQKFLREISVCQSFYIDIVDTRTGISKRITFDTEKLGGQRFSKKLRFFVPSAYTNLKSMKYVIKDNEFSNKEILFKTRLNNYFTHYTESELITGANYEISPLKVVKRTLQCTDILAPVLTKDNIKQIHSDTYAVLSSSTIANLNDYLVANNNLRIFATSMPEIFKTNANNQIWAMEQILSNMIVDPYLDYHDLKPLFEYQKIINANKNNISAVCEIMYENNPAPHIHKLMLKNMPDYKKFIGYNKFMEKVLELGGLYRTKLYKDEEGHIFVLKNKYTGKIPATEFKKIDLMNGYETQQFDNTTKFDVVENIPEGVNYWFRYNPTKQEQIIWEEIRTRLEKDKKNFIPKIKVGILRRNS